MAIDGRDIARARARREAAESGAPAPATDAYESRGVRFFAQAVVWIPVAIVIWLSYVTGAWIGGVGAGVLSVVSTVLMVAGWIVWRRIKGNRRR